MKQAARESTLNTLGKMPKKNSIIISTKHALPRQKNYFAYASRRANALQSKVLGTKRATLLRSFGRKAKAASKEQTKKKFLNKLSRWYENLKNAQPEQFALVFVQKTKNNIHGVISTLFGTRKTLWSTSGGVYSNKINGRRKTRNVQRTVLNHLIDRTVALGVKYLVIQCWGTFISKRAIYQTFSKRLIVLLLKDITSTPHNGCRPRKARRL